MDDIVVSILQCLSDHEKEGRHRLLMGKIVDNLKLGEQEVQKHFQNLVSVGYCDGFKRDNRGYLTAFLTAKGRQYYESLTSIPTQTPPRTPPTVVSQ
jgi:predicted transcriptional regulator